MECDFTGMFKNNHNYIIEIDNLLYNLLPKSLGITLM